MEKSKFYDLKNNAYAYFEKGDWIKGNAIFEEALTFFNDETEKGQEIYFLARWLYDLGQYDKALQCFERTLNLNEHHKTYNWMGRIFKHQGQLEKAFEFFKKSYEMKMDQDGSAFDYAQALYERGDVKTALTVVDQILSRNKVFGPARKLRDKISIK